MQDVTRRGDVDWGPTSGRAEPLFSVSPCLLLSVTSFASVIG
jgi:hypothetical protein